jgi:hypothetical protein
VKRFVLGIKVHSIGDTSYENYQFELLSFWMLPRGPGPKQLRKREEKQSKKEHSSNCAKYTALELERSADLPVGRHPSMCMTSTLVQ